MAKFEEIVKRESERSELAHWREIYLYAEGKFCHAYDQSAWLYSRFAPVALNATQHKSKQFPDGSYIMVGHPQTSLEKYQPKDSHLTETDGMVNITLPETAIMPRGICAGESSARSCIPSNVTDSLTASARSLYRIGGYSKF